MAVIQNLYKIFKLPASMIASAPGLSIDCYTLAMGLRDGNVVAIGDNQVFQQLRYLKGDERGHREIYAACQKLHAKAEAAKREGDYSKSRVYRQLLNDHLFVREVVNVEVDGKKSDFRKFCVKGFSLNGAKYVYLCSGSGQIRRNTATFIREDLKEPVAKALNCGLDEKTEEFVLAKYTAYFALSFSSVMWVRTPRVCVIKDFFRTVKDQPVDFIVRDSADPKAEARLERRIMDIELNCADGQGLIDPGFAKLWAGDMDLPYVPCTFVARSCFIKGNLATFDFRAYAHEHGIETIKDKWGKEYPIDEIDVLISESQFKTHKYYSSWQEYLSYAEAGRVRWGVARYSKEKDAEMTQANYQYIQTLDLSQEDLKGLVRPTVEWIHKVCSGDPMATVLYMLGAADEGSLPQRAYRKLYSSAQTVAMKAVVKNNAFLADPHVQAKVRKNIKEAIQRAKLGRIWIRGNYQFLVSDPVAQCQAALGLDPVGVVPANHVWCDFWRKRLEKEGQSLGFAPKGEVGPGPWVDVCRSPMIDVHEHNPSTVMIGNDEADRWLSHLYSGCVLSTYDTSTARGEDCDFDGDIVLCTNDPYFLKGANKDHPIITYEKGLAKPAKMTVKNITETVIKGFGTGVGGFSNAATCMYAMAAIFKPDDPRRAELYRRIKLEREIVGQEIDRIKGADKPYLPTKWKQYEQIPDPASGATQDDIRAAYRRNSMVIAKKPYFFRYLYPELDALHKRFEASYDSISLAMFGVRFKSLLKVPRPERTKDQDDLVRRYEKYNPLITSPCAMNLLCRAVESEDFDLRFGRAKDGSREDRSGTLLPLYPEIDLPKEKLEAAEKAYREYKAKRQSAAIGAAAKELGVDESLLPESKAEAMDALLADVRAIIQGADILPPELLRACGIMSKSKKHFDWGFAWDTLDTAILPLIPQGETKAPAPSSDGETEYLGVRYKVIDATDYGEVRIERLLRAAFGDYDGWGADYGAGMDDKEKVDGEQREEDDES